VHFERLLSDFEESASKNHPKQTKGRQLFHAASPLTCFCKKLRLKTNRSILYADVINQAGEETAKFRFRLPIFVGYFFFSG
jgi:hypothetical protein